MQAAERLFITADKKRLVREGHKDGAFLYVAPGDEIPDSAAEMFGLVDGKLKVKADRKEGGKPNDKEDNGGKNKGGGDKTGDGEPASDDLTSIKGIGAKTAETLGKAGLTSFTALAAVDIAAPPSIEGLSPSFDWAAVKEAAALQLAAQEAA